VATAQKISQLTTAGPLTGAELVPVVQNSGTLQTTVSALKAYTIVSITPEISALNTRVDQVSALISSNAVAIASLSAQVSGALVAVASLSAAVSTLTIRVDDVSAIATSIGAVVSTFDTRISDVSAAVVSVNEVVSALDIRVSDVSAAVVSVNNVVSALEVRVSSVSAVASANTAAIANVSALVSAVDVRVAAVSASVSALNVQMVQALASISAINSVLATIDTSAITGLEVRVSTLEIRVTDVSASVSALQVQLNAVSALTSVNAAAITSINAVVSTKVNRVGDYMDSVQYIEFDTSTVIATSVGRLSWDIDYGTLDIGLSGGNANVLVGQRQVAYVYNNTAATIEKGKVVEVTGASGQRLTVKLAQANSDANSATILGIMLETVSVNNSGYVGTNGIIRNVDTGAFTDGQIVYLSPVSAGELTATKPVAPQHLVLIGYVVKGGSVGAGSIYVNTQNGYELGELHDVKVSSSLSIANNEVLAYNTSAGVWTNSTVLIETQASISVLQIQVDAVSAATSVNAAHIAAVSASVSALQIQVDAVSVATSVNAAAITSVNAVISALDTRVGAVSAATSVNAVAIAAVAASVSVLQIQVDAVSAATSVNAVAIAAVSAVVSTLQIQVNEVSAAVSAALVSVSQRVLKAGDTMSGELNMADNLVTRPKFKDYALQVVTRASASATTTLDLTEGNFFAIRAAGSTTFVFANPPVSSANGPAGGGFILELQNGGAATVTWPAAVDWPGGTAPTLTSSGYDVFVFITDDGGTVWRGVQSMKDSK
jgi:hypothetical protein